MPVKLPTTSGGGGSSNLLDGINFPLTISKTQPTAIREGHIWIDNDNDSKITKVKILETLNTSEESGTLMLVVGDLANHSFSFSNPLKSTNGSSKTVSISNTTSSNALWNIMNKTDVASSSFKINTPIAYSKVDNILDMENAYMWNGASWTQLSQKGSYLAYIESTTSLKLQNFNTSTNELTNNTSFTIPEGNLPNTKFTRNGMYLIVGDKIYKRSGDTFTLYFTIPTSATGGWSIVPKTATLSEDGQVLVVGRPSGSNTGFVVYKNNGTTFTVSQIVNGVAAFSSSSEFVMPYVNASGTAVLLLYSIAPSSRIIPAVDLFIATNGTFPNTGTRLDSFDSSSGTYSVKVLTCPFNDTLFTYSVGDSYSSTTDYIISIAVDIKNNTYTRNIINSNYSNTYEVLGWIDNIIVYDDWNYSTSTRTYRGKDMVNGTIYTIVSPMNISGGLVMNTRGDKGTVWTDSGTGYIVSVTKSGTTITLELLKTFSMLSYGKATII